MSATCWTRRLRIARPDNLLRVGDIGYSRLMLSRSRAGRLYDATKWIMDPSKRKTAAYTAAHRWTACTRMVSNTGWKSVGDCEITRRISAVAVWRYSDSFVS